MRTRFIAWRLQKHETLCDNFKLVLIFLNFTSHYWKCKDKRMQTAPWELKILLVLWLCLCDLRLIARWFDQLEECSEVTADFDLKYVNCRVSKKKMTYCHLLIKTQKFFIGFYYNVWPSDSITIKKRWKRRARACFQKVVMSSLERCLLSCWKNLQVLCSIGYCKTFRSCFQYVPGFLGEFTCLWFGWDCWT